MLSRINGTYFQNSHDRREIVSLHFLHSRLKRMCVYCLCGYIGRCLFICAQRNRLNVFIGTTISIGSTAIKSIDCELNFVYGFAVNRNWILLMRSVRSKIKINDDRLPPIYRQLLGVDQSPLVRESDTLFHYVGAHDYLQQRLFEHGFSNFFFLMYSARLLPCLWLMYGVADFSLLV